MSKSRQREPGARWPQLRAFADAELDEDVKAARARYPYWPGILLSVLPLVLALVAFYTFSYVLAFHPVLAFWKWGFGGFLALTVLAILFKSSLYQVLYVTHELLKHQRFSPPQIPLPASAARAVMVWIVWPLLLATALLFTFFALLYPFHLLVAEEKRLIGIVTYTVPNDCWVSDAWSLDDGLGGV